jgi:hypothetical protein
MIIFELILTTFETSFNFRGSWGSIKNWFELKIKPPLADLAFAKSLKHTVGSYKMSISPTFYARLFLEQKFCTQVFFAFKFKV